MPTGPKIIKVLVDYAAKIEQILAKMRVHFTKPEQVIALEPMSHEKILNLTFETKVLPSLEEWVVVGL